MIEFDEACELIFENTSRLGTEERLIESAIGCVLAQDVVSPIDVAPFRNSAMDGFAIKSQWLRECSTDSPREVPISSTLFAGDSAANHVDDRHTVKVMTGTRVPDRFDAVVPFEETDYADDEVRFFNPAVPGQHIREAGEDIACGQKLYTKETKLGQLDIGVLAAIGLRSVMTYRKPSIMIIGTGDELTDPGDKLTGNGIYDSNTYTILSLVAPYCDRAERISRLPDREKELRHVLLSSHDVIVTSGGVSAGERDLVVDIAESCGWQRVFHKVRIKPGKPVYFAVREKQVLFGLPGNPLSAAVTCSVFLIPALKKMAGLADYRLCPKPAQLVPEAIRKSGRKLIWPGFIREEAGRTVVRFSPKKSSAALTALLGTDGLIIQDATDGGPGEVIVKAIPWSHILKL
ncbi:MAG: molybdopterin molybdotransferase MoeA [candidate division Zixibacteria bacterium]|nr:molybdopterin molybdotransferase MoeA [candidate division Zixibacteria bacterium]MBU1470080.1 molybdopterin molybdotransferase MoeA [candidate division Zixibacteria bacterium]MBU2624400.1 molybdopterin molybdotransferase MoeA [candidate division Zixibacteria bacterium]